MNTTQRDREAEARYWNDQAESWAGLVKDLLGFVTLFCAACWAAGMLAN